MSCSLTLGALELMSGPYSAQVGTSMGRWQSITTSTTSLFLDGSVVSGDATANREISLQVQVEASTRTELVAACEALIVEANKASKELVWTHADGPAPIVYDVFRVDMPKRVDDESEAFLSRTYELTFPAMPFARSGVREYPAAYVPAVTIADFEAPFTGARLSARPYPTGVNSAWWAMPVGANATTPLVNLAPISSGNFTAVTNCGITYGALTGNGRGSGYGAALVTATASGLVEVQAASIQAVTADVATVGFNVQTASSLQFIVGVEWLDATTSLRIDWGTPMRQAKDLDTMWTVSARPTAATRCRGRIRAVGALTGNAFQVSEMMIVPSTIATITPVPGFQHDGLGGVNVSGELAGYIPNPNGIAGMPTTLESAYLFGRIATTLDLSAQAWVSLWARPGDNVSLTDATLTDTLSLRLFDSTGKWSLFWMRHGALDRSVWRQFGAALATPYATSTSGAANLSNIVAYDIGVRGEIRYGLVSNGDGTWRGDIIGMGGYYDIDTITAGPVPGATTSPRGTVYQLDAIKGSARSAAQVSVFSGTALTDWLVAAVDPNDGPPLLSVTANVAIASAPVGYSGVYSIVGCLSPATLLTTPTCTVVQKNGGVTIATRVLTGITRADNHYVDFGAVELPLVQVTDENNGVSIEFTLAPTSTAWVDVLAPNTDASLAWVETLSVPAKRSWIDEADATTGLGTVWVGTLADRSDARAPLAPPVLSSPMQVKAPSVNLLVYSTTIGPNVSLSYFPRYLTEPTS